jgi:hypothetical protein
VDAGFRPYAMKLIWPVLKRRDVTYTNISPAPSTLNANKALGFRLFAGGQFALSGATMLPRRPAF